MWQNDATRIFKEESMTMQQDWEALVCSPNLHIVQAMSALGLAMGADPGEHRIEVGIIFQWE